MPRKRTGSVIAVAACLLLDGPSVVLAQPRERACDVAAAKAERDWSLPAGVLSAVGTVESGRAAGVPWPWTINAAGRGSYHGSKAEAVAAVLAIMATGFAYIDVGCFQIDIAYHAGVFNSLEDAFDPDRNAQEAARILTAERRRAPDWATAVARYHSATPAVGEPYLNRVRDALPTAKLRALEAELEAVINAQSTKVSTMPSLTSTIAPDIAATITPSLPKVIYGQRVAPGTPAPQIINLSKAKTFPRVTPPSLQPKTPM